jgi:hypothetical protein
MVDKQKKLGDYQGLSTSQDTKDDEMGFKIQTNSHNILSTFDQHE